MISSQTRPISGRLLARNVIWNFLGTGAPLIIAIAAIPLLIEGMGTARFGVLTMAWMVVGYFSLFDIGLGRALTKMVAENIGKGMHEKIPVLIWTTMSLMTALGIFGSAIVASLTPWLVNSVLNIPADLQDETLTAFYLLSVGIPVVIGTTGFRGILEAHQRFRMVNSVRIPVGIFTFLGPVMVLPYSTSLVPVVTVLIASRVVSWCVYAAMCLHIEPALRYTFRVDYTLIRPLFNFGGWMSVTNIIGPLMVYMDRFLIGSMVSMTALAYYTTPYEVVNKVLIIPGALVGVMFPAFASIVVQDRERAAYLFERAINYIFLSLFPIVLIIVTFAYDGLNLWLGANFANNSCLILQLLAVGVFINGHAYVPSGLVQGAGRPDLTAKLHLLELPFYIMVLWWLVGSYGIKGAAIAWVMRVALDATLLFIMAHKLLSSESPLTMKSVTIHCISLFLLIFGGVVTGTIIKLLYLFSVISFFLVLSWFVLINKEEKEFFKNWLNKIISFRINNRTR